MRENGHKAQGYKGNNTIIMIRRGERDGETERGRYKERERECEREREWERERMTVIRQKKQDHTAHRITISEAEI